ncbi:MAG: cytochrome c-type biogenesis protein CcmH [Candidatus Dadabacteria bacterium]|nr:MAG: cytochrome c-type biogenesis protein CcmH [Candidatus Dadabacteria bacterium]
MRHALPIVLLLLPLVALPGWGSDVASDLTPEQEWRCLRLYEELKCPVCKTQSLASSTSFLAEDMKAQIRDFVREGRSDQEIMDYYVDRYGDWILMRPPARGFSLLAWIVPVLGVLAAFGFVLVVLRRWSRSAAADVAAGANVETPVSAIRDERVRRLVDQ